ncbi:MAG: penicillin acylase family protein [bacterium]
MKFTALICVLVLVSLAGCGGDDRASSVQSESYEVTVTRTTYGIPHINAPDFGSLGYGYGYAFAQDNLCTMMEDFVAIRGERSKYWGGEGAYSIPAVGVAPNNVDSDFFWKFMADAEAVRRLRDATPPEVRQVVHGYVDGFNRYITELQAGEHPGEQAACAEEPYLEPITDGDMYRRFVRLAIMASSEALIAEIATAQPPASGTAGSPEDPVAQLEDLERVDLAELPSGLLRRQAMGSNMYALGPDATGGEPIVFGNPHFPWTGTERFYLAHMTLPGTIDIEGASLFGAPVVMIGFNDRLAWSHTVSTAYRFTFYKLSLSPANPTQYIYDGQTENMTAVPLSVEVRNQDGSTTTQERTLYRSRYGPMVVFKVGRVPVLGWDRSTAFTLRDANYENDRVVKQFFEWDKAESLDEFKRLHASILGVPWVNTVASGPGGDAYYGDVSVVPHVTDAQAESCAVWPYSDLIGLLVPGLPLMDGSSKECQWGTDPDAPAPGIFGPGHLPTLDRGDWVANMNDSYWLTNPAQPITGYNRIIGLEGTERSLRTRQGILQIQHRLDGSDGFGGPNLFDLPNLKEIVLSGHIYTADLAQAAVLSDLCPRAGIYDTEAACSAIRQWDGAATLSSVGLPVWQQFWGNLLALPSNYWITPFDVNDPVNTPRDLNTSLFSVRKALFDAQTRIEGAGLSLAAPLGEQQHAGVNDPTIPIFGEGGAIGAFTIAEDSEVEADPNALGPEGYRIDFGNSYIQVVTWDSGGVHAEGFLTYSQSTDPASPHYADFTEAYSQKRWQRLPFHPDEIAADRISQITLSGTPSPVAE